jgi:hypothetical protein
MANVGTPLKNKLMICDFNDMSFTSIDIAKRANCPSCEGAAPAALRERLVWLCGQNTANINPETPLKLNLPRICETVQALGYHVRVKSNLALIFDFEGREVSLFNGGRMLIRKVQDESAALKVYKEVLQKLGIAQKGQS